MLETLNFKPAIIVLTETWLSETNKSMCNIEGYNSYHTIRMNRRSGGVSVFVDSRLESFELEEYCISNEFMESCVVRVKSNVCDLICFAVYRSHSETIASFDANLNNILTQTFFNNKNIILLGDLNINILEEGNNSIDQFMYNLQSLTFMPIISRPTRFLNNILNPSLLDHIWINYLTNFHAGIILDDSTDHCPTFVRLPTMISLTSVDNIKISFRESKPRNVDLLSIKIQAVDWNEFFIGDVNIDTKKFIDFLDKMYCVCCPLKTKYISMKRFGKPWLSSGILRSIKTKSEYLKLYKRGVISCRDNKAYRNVLNKVIKEAKRQYYDSYFSINKFNAKKTWEGLKKLMEKSPRQSVVKTLDSNGIHITDQL